MARRAVVAGVAGPAGGGGGGSSPPPASDPVNHPAHYTAGSIECIDAIESALGRDGFVAFLRGQVIKYSWRLGRKGDSLEDAQKALWYQRRLVETLSKEE